MTLRAPRMGDAEAIAVWLPGALTTAIAGADEAGRAADSLRAKVEASDPAMRIIEADGEPQGIAAVEREGDDVRIAAVAVRPEARGRGLSAMALVAIEASLAPRPRRLLAPVAPSDGRALYFWLRLGYRPIVIDGRVWMEREMT